MSWSWKDELEHKEYETKGTVTIGTDEYRDMLSEIYRLQNAGQREHDDWYKEKCRADNLAEELKKTCAKLDEILAWMDACDGSECNVRLMFKQWKFTRQEENNE